MPVDLRRFAVSRPFLYHLTASGNVRSIRSAMRIESAAKLMKQAGKTALVKSRRRGMLELVVAGNTVVIRDQDPLHARNIELRDGWSFERFIESLNCRVFFWPGVGDGPNGYGKRHFARYRSEEPSILRVPFEDMLDANPGIDPLFCRYNSGSPRWSRGKPSPRGPQTFIPACVFSSGVAQVVEVTFLDEVALPRSTQVATLSDSFLWKRLAH